MAVTEGSLQQCHTIPVHGAEITMLPMSTTEGQQRIPNQHYHPALDCGLSMGSEGGMSFPSQIVSLEGDPVLVDEQSATSFLSRSLLYNSWDFELVVTDNLERECVEERCSYEEAREVFEDDTMAQAFWKDYSQEYAPKVDVAGLVAGILAALLSAAIVTVLGIYCYKAKNKSGQRSTQ
ncbi:transmembrane gamma-carboxyglutamic acid protein 4-like [Morone saxatilis]|uniref:transmembrane gamma-carboxyglutamic acid protein 4-like n=1 Tax=Morone saxatilis TaxID=34816 RepID=UPI0015E24089|nr:transmembrane gamma-carboxyglutamic acid protein 4-like [Morone saxatilis]